MNQKIDIRDISLKGERIILRPWNYNDLDDLYEYAKMDDCSSRAGWMKVKNLDTAKFFLGHFVEDHDTFAIEYQNKVIGNLSIHRYPEILYPKLNRYLGTEIGFVLNKDYWGQAIMKEAIDLVIDYLFKDLQIDFILASHFLDNQQSARVLNKCGFKVLNKEILAADRVINKNLLNYILVNPLKKND